MIIDPVHPVAVVEERNGLRAAVSQHAVESSIQVFRKLRLFGEMNKVRCALPDRVVTSPESLDAAAARKILPGKHQREVALLMMSGMQSDIDPRCAVQPT